ncbi:iron-sulfur protein [Prauserella marina]|uniref:Ferric iron reductase protein FhuF, involved in iron transport n=1 Tax=Prauserella marina TaxID=530584 RepID=A0A222VXE6_9PSEU|nr:(2Fe-2S)-binding protein [Prauserella marina]ASR38353.1 iron-sulfur protein [Prauserella marina]PWV78430.1 ferric iron reductase protein FhuF [Prauserella marina]SDC85805.1 Ferric iron reductase protein FhuF, involved in iron transport [Prauserella marina]
MAVDRSLRDAQHIRADLDSLGGSLARVARFQHRFELRTTLPEAESWWRCSDLLANPETFLEWRRRLGAWLLAEHGAQDARTTAGYIMSWYLRVPAYLGALLLHHERRVPSLRPEELAVRIADHGRPEPVGLAALGGSFYCLPLDPGSARPEATVVADERALAAILRARYTAHAARFVRAYGKVSPLGSRMLWAAATDALDTSLWWAGRDGGDEGAGVADAALVLGSRFAPLTSASTLHMGETEAGKGWCRMRESCCFSYLLPQQDECAECPRLRKRAR